MLKKMPVTPRPAQSTAKTDAVTRVSAEAVSLRAYYLFQARGSEHGHDVEDWLLAETGLLNGNNTEIASRQREANVPGRDNEDLSGEVVRRPIPNAF
jgi:hypothetical protein